MLHVFRKGLEVFFAAAPNRDALGFAETPDAELGQAAEIAGRDAENPGLLAVVVLDVDHPLGVSRGRVEAIAAFEDKVAFPVRDTVFEPFGEEAAFENEALDLLLDGLRPGRSFVFTMLLKLGELVVDVILQAEEQDALLVGRRL
jgi:hypothetical protein